ncbi:hypothetical protein RJ641_018934 [Dillenia turbinata]|uniref:Uncharacterized protein n=1 Tax=Dillenia turbinata TaxID=194707 RepID=A0AAN8UG07_9MAGN
MSLALLQGYSSPEQEEGGEDDALQYQSSSDGEENDQQNNPIRSYHANPNSNFHSSIDSRSNWSSLPSAFDAFSEISGPPEFLNNSVQEQVSLADSDEPWRRGRHGGRRNNKEKKDLPAGAVVEAKAQLVGIRDRVRSDVDGNFPPTPFIQPQKSSVGTTQGGDKRVATATNPNAEDAAELLRMCLQCGIPKTFSSARGMVCPQCSDQPPKDTTDEPKKKGSTIKEKEKSKRMRGQSSHATWKSETEMHLRQQFD